MKYLPILISSVIFCSANGQGCLSGSDEIYADAIRKLVLVKSDIFKKAKADGGLIVLRQEGLGIADPFRVVLVDNDTITMRIIDNELIRQSMSSSNRSSQWFVDINAIIVKGMEMSVSFNSGIYLTNKKRVYSHVDKESLVVSTYRLNIGTSCWEAVE
jgi:hypothetical protein